MKIEQAIQVNIVLKELKRLEKKVSRYDEKSCNIGLSERQEAKQEALVNEADRQAKRIGLKVYHQTDPRGCALYLVALEAKGAEDYTNGLPLC